MVSMSFIQKINPTSIVGNWEIIGWGKISLVHTQKNKDP